ncbi:hypothetical protein GCM10010400_58210 [Streptomyces aculeolatus]|uniref:hypothetical protein n=1 Tax=Streptomyces aculeolatus TaxID=270689 RepID=UPI001CED595C|nr:hypothetical protein [Streptomyces aculeolatus]
MTPDPADRDAITSLAARIRRRDEAPADERPDPEVLAQEYVTALRSHGWRPTAAAPPAPADDWRTPARPAGPDAVRRHAAAARAALRSHTTPTEPEETTP